VYRPEKLGYVNPPYGWYPVSMDAPAFGRGYDNAADVPVAALHPFELQACTDVAMEYPREYAAKDELAVVAFNQSCQPCTSDTWSSRL
jgi:hypothetical protein